MVSTKLFNMVMQCVLDIVTGVAPTLNLSIHVREPPI